MRPELDARPVVPHRLLELALDRRAVAMLLHVDEVDDDEPGEVAQAQLPRDLLGGLDIGLERRLLDVALARRAARVHVDRDERLGRVDDDVAAGRELHDRRMDRVDLLLDLVAVQQRHARVAIELHALGVARHQHLHEGLGGLVAFLAVDHDLVDVARVEIADRALDEVALLVDQRRRRRFEREVPDLVPEAQQIFEVALDLGLGALAAGGADDDAHALGQIEIAHHLLEAAPVDGARDLARHAAAARRVRHEHAVPPGEREICGERRALVAALLLHDLHQHDLAALDDFLDLVVAIGAGAGTRSLFELVAADRLDRLGMVLGRLAQALVAHRLGGRRDRGRFVGGCLIARLGPGELAWRLGRRTGLGCLLIEPVIGVCAAKRVARIGRAGIEGGILFLGQQRHRLAQRVGGCRKRRVSCAVRLAELVIVVVFRRLAQSLGLGVVRLRFVFSHPVATAFARLLAGVGGLLGGALGVERRLAVGDRNPVIVRMNFAEGEEPVPIAAIFDEGGLQRRLDARYLGKIDVALDLFLGRSLEIELFELATIEDDDPGFFRMGRVDQHALDHRL